MMKLYTIGEVSGLVGLSTKTIRYYESIQLLSSSQRKENNYRMYSENDIQKLRLVVEAKNLGIPLIDVKRVVSACFDEGCTHLKAYLTKQIPEYLSQANEKILELQKLRKRLISLQNKLQTTTDDTCSDCFDKNECYKYLQVE